MLKPLIPSYLELIPLLPSHETVKTMQNNHGLDHHISFLGQRVKGQGDNKQGGIKKGRNQGGHKNVPLNTQGRNLDFSSKGRGFTQHDINRGDSQDFGLGLLS